MTYNNSVTEELKRLADEYAKSPKFEEETYRKNQVKREEKSGEKGAGT